MVCPLAGFPAGSPAGSPPVGPPIGPTVGPSRCLPICWWFARQLARWIARWIGLSVGLLIPRHWACVAGRVGSGCAGLLRHGVAHTGATPHVSPSPIFPPPASPAP
eukprot:349686-Chlamydomonas_euryale.AAC.19